MDFPQEEITASVNALINDALRACRLLPRKDPTQARLLMAMSSLSFFLSQESMAHIEMEMELIRSLILEIEGR
jgi:hypothetical protein